MIAKIEETDTDAVKRGCVLALVGLSGTGKGTTVEKLKEHVQNKAGKAVTWSNGNVFRCLTMHFCDHCERVLGGSACLESLSTMEEEKLGELTAENIASWMQKITFGEFEPSSASPPHWDIRVDRGGEQLYVSEICNTLLKEPRISKHIPSVAGKTQGEVVLFAANACKKMGEGGSVVVVEGREDTVNFIPTPHRFCLTMSDTSVIGQRRAAQRVVAEALRLEGHAEPTEGLRKAVEAMTNK
ncbi:unnamed protein product [Amoebophrya sp. A25]|nr:unnamed protein product [Amoebophrya sp. A25]|eukprot:GSA25T00012154001.1